MIAAVGLMPASALAFGIGDLVSIGLRAGSEIVRAAAGEAVDSIKESMRDPEAEARKKAEQERKLAEQMQKQIDEIEAQPNLRPIDRERLVLQLKKTWEASKEMQAFVQRAEAQQRAERRRVLTAEGIVGSIGQAAMNSPSVVMAQAELMTKNPLWREEQRLRNEAVFRQVDAMLVSGLPQAKARAAIAQADLLVNTGLPEAGARSALDNAEVLAHAKQSAHPVDLSFAPHTSAPSLEMARNQEHEHDAFSPDLGKKIWIEFEDAPNETEALRKLLRKRGHVVVHDREEAEVAYLIQGEYTIPETKRHDELLKRAGAILENPEQKITPPANKLMGRISTGIGRFLLGASGANVPTAHDDGYHQVVLLVIARQPKDGKETRASVVQKEQSKDLEAARLVQKAKQELYAMLGI